MIDMQITLDGNMEISAPSSTTMSFLSNTRDVAACIPDSEGFTDIDGKKFTMKVRVGLGLVRGVFDMKGAIVDRQGNHIAYELNGRGIGSTAKITLALDVTEKAPGVTSAAWSSTFDLSGLISGVGAGIIKKVSDSKIEEIIINLKAHIESSTKQPNPTERPASSAPANAAGTQNTGQPK